MHDVVCPCGHLGGILRAILLDFFNDTTDDDDDEDAEKMLFLGVVMAAKMSAPWLARMMLLLWLILRGLAAFGVHLVAEV